MSVNVEKLGINHYDLEKEMSQSNMAMLLNLFKRESDRYEEKCTEYFNHIHKYGMPADGDGAKKLHDEASFILEGRYKLAMSIAEIMTDTSRVQHEIIPKPKGE